MLSSFRPRLSDLEAKFGITGDQVEQTISKRLTVSVSSDCNTNTEYGTDARKGLVPNVPGTWFVRTGSRQAASRIILLFST